MLPGLSLVAAGRGYSLLQCLASGCGGFLCCGVWAVGTWATAVAQAGLVAPGYGMWDLPGPGIELMSPALAGFFTMSHYGNPTNS